MTAPFTVSSKHCKYLATGTSAVEAVITLRAEATDPAVVPDPAGWPDVRLRVWAQAGAQVTGLRQLIPAGGDLQGERREVGAGTWEHPLGPFTPGEERTLHLRLVDVGEHRETAGFPHAVGRVSVHLGDVEVEAPVARSTIEAVWSDDPDAAAERDADAGGGTMQQFMAGALADARDARDAQDARNRAAEASVPSDGPGTAPDPDEASRADDASGTRQPSGTDDVDNEAGPATVEFPPESDRSGTDAAAPPTTPPAPRKSGKGRPRRPAAPAGEQSSRPAPPTEEPSAGSGAAVTTPSDQAPKPPGGGARGRPRRRTD